MPLHDLNKQPTSRYQTFPKGSREGKRDLKRRNGGWKSSDPRNAEVLKQVTTGIGNGDISILDAEALRDRNPGAKIAIQTAITRRQQRQGILTGAIDLPQERLQQIAGASPGAGTRSFEDFPSAETFRQEGKLNVPRAIDQARKVGRFDLVKQLQSSLPKQRKTREPKFVVKKITDKQGATKFVRLSEGDLSRGVKTFKRISNKDAADIDTSLAVARNIAIPLFNALNPKISSKKRAELKAQGITADPSAVGSKGFLADFILNRVDPKGTSVRQLSTNLSSAILKQRSGAQVSDKEYARLQPFLLTGKETSSEALKKSRLLVREYLAILRERNKTFSAKNGFVPHSGLKRFFSKDQSVKAIQARAENARRQPVRRKQSKPQSGVVDFGDLPSRGR